MKFLIALLFLFATLTAGTVTSAPATETPAATSETLTAAGNWEGAIQVPTGELGVLVSLKAGDAGAGDDGAGEDQAWSGTIDIPAQSLQGFALSNVSVEGQKVHFEMGGVPGQPTFKGHLADAGDSIEGTFQQGGQSLPFSLQRSQKAPAEAEPEVVTEAVPGESMDGEWLGTLNVGPVKLRLVLRAETQADGTLTASLESVDQGAKFPTDAISFSEKQLKLSLQRIGASFKGVMNQDGSTVVGIWSQGGNTLPLTFHRLAEPFALPRPQNPKAPFPYDSQDVTFRNPGAEINLAGTLLVPHQEGPFPAVVFVTGSGAQDRDETMMGHKPFLVLADHLARHGIASLRFDDRGAGESEGDHIGSTVGDFASDVNAALTFLAQQPKIDRKGIGIVGHSEGGLSGPRAALDDEEVDFLVLLAPPGEPLDDLILRQNRAELERQGTDEALIQRGLATAAATFALLRDASLDREALVQKLKAHAEAQKKEFTEEERTRLGLTPAAIAQSIGQVSTPYFRSLIQEDSTPLLNKTRIPTLALFGERDSQVPPEFNAKLVEEALKKAGNKDYEVRTLPELNHLFQHAKTGQIGEYGTIEETFSPEALEIISSWIAERFKPAS